MTYWDARLFLIFFLFSKYWALRTAGSPALWWWAFISAEFRWRSLSLSLLETCKKFCFFLEFYDQARIRLVKSFVWVTISLVELFEPPQSHRIRGIESERSSCFEFNRPNMVFAVSLLLVLTVQNVNFICRLYIVVGGQLDCSCVRTSCTLVHKKTQRTQTNFRQKSIITDPQRSSRKLFKGYFWIIWLGRHRGTICQTVFELKAVWWRWQSAADRWWDLGDLW